jgi:hypothetical protein
MLNMFKFLKFFLPFFIASRKFYQYSFSPTHASSPAHLMLHTLLIIKFWSVWSAFIFYGPKADLGSKPPHCTGFYITHTAALLWTSDQSVTGTGTVPTQHTTNTTDEQPCPQRDWNRQTAIPSIELVQTYPVVCIATGVRWRSWLKHCARSRKVAGIFHRHNPSDCTMTLVSTQTLTEMSTRNVSWLVKAFGVECLEVWKPQPPGKRRPLQAPTRVSLR